MSTTASTILEPRLACQAGKRDDPFECSVHTLPKPLLREFRHVFGEVHLQDIDSNSMSDDHLELLAIPTNQQARQDLVAVGEAVELEKDRLLNVVRSFFARNQPSTIRATLTVLLFLLVYGIWTRNM
jgi:hypothetical protein